MLIASAGLTAKEKNKPIHPRIINPKSIHRSTVYHHKPTGPILVLEILNIYFSVPINDSAVFEKISPRSLKFLN